MSILLLVPLWLLLLVALAAPMEHTEIGRRIADGLLARIFPPRGV